ncbi:MAG: triose-phosphate isomerase family protein, partial [Nitrospinota bacterium]
AFIAEKAAAAREGGLIPILCLGETLPTREAGNTLEHIDRQLQQSFFDAFRAPPSDFVFAYEPIWAIGTGINATPEQAQEVHAHIRQRLGEIHGLEWAAETRILYGGSVNPKNAAGLFAQKDIDGGLIGGASLKSEDFLAIIRAAIAE